MMESLYISAWWTQQRNRTIIKIAKEMNISLDAIVFPDTATATVSKTVTDFFAGKSEAEIQKYISLCRQADAFKTDKKKGDCSE